MSVRTERHRDVSRRITWAVTKVFTGSPYGASGPTGAGAAAAGQTCARQIFRAKALSSDGERTCTDSAGRLDDFRAIGHLGRGGRNQRALCREDCRMNDLRPSQDPTSRNDAAGAQPAYNGASCWRVWQAYRGGADPNYEATLYSDASFEGAYSVPGFGPYTVFNTITRPSPELTAALVVRWSHHPTAEHYEPSGDGVSGDDSWIGLSIDQEFAALLALILGCRDSPMALRSSRLVCWLQFLGNLISDGG